ncbi:hypothetical protein SAMN05443549_106154 [Flavobacterium fluvii]|uniref:DUF2231 domain-containing protein n=1 Tax=Flavobacterium fluvii TaxID=468056 RepID=A0A1M5MG40_9FLAO|nr:DUF2231 domain-containing protein [Flavobacterium fluvii]SHG76216.1 hypothetical protein SAMN05443549_106154 [Flavobacterium fluvii]
MNEAHLHLLVNHYPIVGTILGLGVLMAGMIIKKDSVKNTAYVLFVIGALFAYASMATGEGAEKLVEDMPNIGDEIIHKHEEMSENFAVVMYILGFCSLLGIYFDYKNHVKSKLVAAITLIIAIVSVIFALYVGTSGGEIRHTEIRDNATQTIGTEKNNAAIEQGEKEKD